MRLFVQEQVLGLDSVNSGCVEQEQHQSAHGSTETRSLFCGPFQAGTIDIQLVWNSTDTTARGKWVFPGDTLLSNLGTKIVVCPFKIVNTTDTSLCPRGGDRRTPRQCMATRT